MSTPSPPNLQQWSQWQLLDSLLPTGGFAHSSGLESFTQSNLLQNLETITTQILENTATLLLPFVHVTAQSPTYATWQHSDKLLNATLTNQTTRQASISQGQSLLRVASQVFVEYPILKTMRDEAMRSRESGVGGVCFHHAPVFGVVCGVLGLGVELSQRLYMFVTLRDVLSAAVRLNLVGPIGGQVLERRIAGLAEEMVVKWMGRGVEEAFGCFPVLDVVQGCHGYLFSRLFCS